MRKCPRYPSYGFAFLYVIVLATGCQSSTPTVDSLPDAAEESTPPLNLAEQLPKQLSQTGLYEDIKTLVFAKGVVSYSVAYPLWADGASIKRYILLPTGQKIDSVDMNNWLFPKGTKIWMQLSKSNKKIETRLLQKELDGAGENSWAMLAYAWNEDESEAVAAIEGVENAKNSGHHIPSNKECRDCHRGYLDVVNGIGAIQLSHGTPSELSTWSQAGMLSQKASQDYLPPGPQVTRDALGYLHGNCGHCHNETHFLSRILKTRLRLRIEEQTPESTNIYKTTMNQAMLHTTPTGANLGIVPGSPDSSQVYFRIGQRNNGYAMPPISTNVVDELAKETIRLWIVSIKP